MTTETVFLTNSFEIFNSSVNELIKEASDLHALKIDTQEQLNELKEKTKNWSDRAIELLRSSFSNQQNEYVTEFINANSNSFTFNSNTTLQFNIDKQKQTIVAKQQTLYGHIKILSVLDYVINPTNIELKARESYTIDEKLNLLLEKLYELYDDFAWPVKELLMGNGIKLKRYNEDRELADMLENRGYITIHDSGLGGGSVNAQLTTEGAMLVENNRKPVKDNYEKINKTSEELSKKIDEIIEHLKILGYGQEVIFNELEELKGEYLKLNKKTWGQLLKGKLIDLSIGKLVENDTIKYIYENLTDNTLTLP